MLDTIIQQFLNGEHPEIPFSLTYEFHEQLELRGHIVFITVPKTVNNREIGTTIKRIPSREIVNKSYIVTHSGQYKVKSTFRSNSVAIEQERL